MARTPESGRARLVAGLYSEQRRILCWLAAVVIALITVLWATGVVDSRTGLLITATVAAALPMLLREFFRMALFIYRRPHDVLRADVLYALLAIGGALIATHSPAPAATVMCALALAALLGGASLTRALRRREAWSDSGESGLMRSMAALGAWSAAGAAIHWAYTQGYSYLVAGALDVSAVAAIAATRLVLMPVNLLSTGIGSLLLPAAFTWSNEHSAATVLRRLVLAAFAVAALSLCYCGIMWLLRDWIFDKVLRQQFARRDLLLLLWSAIFLLMVFRDQLLYLLIARARFRSLTALTLACAALSLTISYVAMRQVGMPGALLGLLIGEFANVLGIVVLSWREVTRPRDSNLVVEPSVVT